MIQTKKDLEDYLRCDNKGYGLLPFYKRWIKRYCGSENYRINEFFRVLRHYEYHLNTGHQSILGGGNSVVLEIKI